MAPRARYERYLALYLRVAGTVTGSAIVPALMPLAWMDAIHRALGLGPLPAGPVVEYLARSLSAFYALHGALLWIFATDVRRYAPPIAFVIGIGLVFGIGIGIVDVRAGLPTPWVLGEGTSVLTLSLVGLFLLARSRSAPPDPQS